jgi:DtxR family Mn-dependent transcriptional regulator
MSHHSDLIDTTEMYLRTIYELEEEGIIAMRARIVERLSQSGPTVSQTISRMERDGLVSLAGDRHLVLTESGRRQAVAVMRKHRLAERLLVDVLGLDWEEVHIEACRWEHVMSDAVERRIVALLKKPLVCPHGNPIPGLAELGLPFASVDPGIPRLSLLRCAAESPGNGITVDRISEQLQPDADLMHELALGGLLPGQLISVARISGGVEVGFGGQLANFSDWVADHVFVTVPGARPIAVGDQIAGSEQFIVAEPIAVA